MERPGVNGGPCDIERKDATKARVDEWGVSCTLSNPRTSRPLLRRRPALSNPFPATSYHARRGLKNSHGRRNPPPPGSSHPWLTYASDRPCVCVDGEKHECVSVTNVVRTSSVLFASRERRRARGLASPGASDGCGTANHFSPKFVVVYRTHPVTGGRARALSLVIVNTPGAQARVRSMTELECRREGDVLVSRSGRQSEDAREAGESRRASGCVPARLDASFGVFFSCFSSNRVFPHLFQTTETLGEERKRPRTRLSSLFACRVCVPVRRLPTGKRSGNFKFKAVAGPWP